MVSLAQAKRLLLAQLQWQSHDIGSAKPRRWMKSSQPSDRPLSLISLEANVAPFSDRTSLMMAASVNSSSKRLRPSPMWGTSRASRREGYSSTMFFNVFSCVFMCFKLIFSCLYIHSRVQDKIIVGELLTRSVQKISAEGLLARSLQEIFAQGFC